MGKVSEQVTECSKSSEAESGDVRRAQFNTKVYEAKVGFNHLVTETPLQVGKKYKVTVEEVE